MKTSLLNITTGIFNSSTVTTSEFAHELNKEIELIHPYINDFGGGVFEVYSESTYLSPGLILSGYPDHKIFRVISTRTKEDFFENIEVATCSLISNKPTERINLNMRFMKPMYSAFTEK